MFFDGVWGEYMLAVLSAAVGSTGKQLRRSLCTCAKKKIKKTRY
jgi:hypothetical protein